jgi:hypothetical protein
MRLTAQILSPTSNIDPGALLNMLPSQGYWEVRAALFQLQGRHVDALRCLVHRLQSVQAAEEYCLRVSERQHPPLPSSATHTRAGSDFDPPAGTGGFQRWLNKADARQPSLLSSVGGKAAREAGRDRSLYDRHIRSAVDVWNDLLNTLLEEEERPGGLYIYI